MTQPTLVILAAGMASRYGSQKQTESFGPNGETIMDYSIYDAIRSGFGKVVFIIREEFADSFKENISAKLQDKIKVEFVYQDLQKLVDPKYLPAERTKPWGTGHAMLCAAEKIHEPFVVINADDFYGEDAFRKAAEFCIEECSETHYAILGYSLKNTLSENGAVSRGVCEADALRNMQSITERTKIFKKEEHIVYEDETGLHDLSPESYVSMNFWCFHPDVFSLTKKLFSEFPEKNQENLKAEFFITTIGDEFIKEQGCVIEIIPTNSSWFGVTYKEDAPGVKEKLTAMISSGSYPENLWA